MRTIKTYSKGAPFYNAFTRTLTLESFNVTRWPALVANSLCPGAGEAYDVRARDLNRKFRLRWFHEWKKGWNILSGHLPNSRHSLAYAGCDAHCGCIYFCGSFSCFRSAIQWFPENMTRKRRSSAPQRCWSTRVSVREHELAWCYLPLALHEKENTARFFRHIAGVRGTGDLR